MVRKILLIVIICASFLLPFDVHSSPIEKDSEFPEKCEKQCKEFFEKEYGNGTQEFAESTDTYSYKNHYNKTMNKCFMLLEGNMRPKDPQKDIIIFEKLVDMNENKIQGVFVSSKTRTSCYLSNTEYKDCTNQKWNELLKPFMGD